MNFGLFVNTIINFLIVAFAVFILVKNVNRFRKEEAPSKKDCPFCLSAFPSRRPAAQLHFGAKSVERLSRRQKILLGHG